LVIACKDTQFPPNGQTSLPPSAEPQPRNSIQKIFTSLFQKLSKSTISATYKLLKTRMLTLLRLHIAYTCPTYLLLIAYQSIP